MGWEYGELCAAEAVCALRHAARHSAVYNHLGVCHSVVTVCMPRLKTEHTVRK